MHAQATLALAEILNEMLCEQTVDRIVLVRPYGADYGENKKKSPDAVGYLTSNDMAINPETGETYFPPSKPPAVNWQRELRTALKKGANR